MTKLLADAKKTDGRAVYPGRRNFIGYSKCIEPTR